MFTMFLRSMMFFQFDLIHVFESSCKGIVVLHHALDSINNVVMKSCIVPDWNTGYSLLDCLITVIYTPGHRTDFCLQESVMVQLDGQYRVAISQR